MYSISKRINIGKKALIKKEKFINDETNPAAVMQFSCCECGHENTVEIVPYQSGFPIFQIYHEDKVLSGNELLRNGMVSETSERMLHLGTFTINDLPTLYFGTDCSFCSSKYICVFSYGEKQQGLVKLTISGIWKFEALQ
ncbi:hypothetical protein [Elizabethkingia miricola]|uniref:hypothetical protein n=1 Tax=Elizabethkingia miricola TaxID=172045 RepID=UPI000C15CAF3|nr:hypothetical protein [Elizabethkingia miricola]NHQ68807.1 hypothetical protein [Elizabethkingia miricola]NHQ72670.1 hypothetical protein [Elizabethkingia miricola]NHQ79769.1 hypothetical protein [Elizabethkingia miricola]PSL86866.1 hypothetical protein C7V10_18525 [Elizabethkingia miricola]QHQ85830.1 hypothetical protein FE632_03045 [Elizabethkingia miricola]